MAKPFRVHVQVPVLTVCRKHQKAAFSSQLFTETSHWELGGGPPHSAVHNDLPACLVGAVYQSQQSPADSSLSVCVSVVSSSLSAISSFPRRPRQVSRTQMHRIQHIFMCLFLAATLWNRHQYCISIWVCVYVHIDIFHWEMVLRKKKVLFTIITTSHGQEGTLVRVMRRKNTCLEQRK